MKLFRGFALALVLAGVVHAQDDKAPMPPPPAGGFTPPVPGAPAPPPPALSAADIERIVDAAVERAVRKAQATAAPTPSAQSLAPALPAAQAPPPQVVYVVAQPPVAQAAYQPVQAVAQPVAQQVNVLVPPGPCKRFLGALGEHFVNKAQPSLRTLQLAPAAYTPVVAPAPIYTPPLPVAQAVAPSPQVPAPAMIYPSKQAPSKR